jgi:hypothetical protein
MFIRGGDLRLGVTERYVYSIERMDVDTQKYEVLQSNITILVRCTAVNSNKNCEHDHSARLTVQAADN